jgi:hypothetical protein
LGEIVTEAVPLDVVYRVRPGDHASTLRYSLRSLSNVPHGRVWIVGYKPTWVCNVGYLPTIQRESKWVNSTNNIRVACEDDRITEDFLYFDDDFFVMRRMESIPTMHRGPIDDVIDYYRDAEYGGSSRYAFGMLETKEIMLALGLAQPLYSYELHMPMTVNRVAMLECLRLAKRIARPDIQCLHKRTLYGNLNSLGGIQVEDCKIKDRFQRWDRGSDFLSTSPKSWMRSSEIRRFIRERFPIRSPYESR